MDFSVRYLECFDLSLGCHILLFDFLFIISTFFCPFSFEVIFSIQFPQENK